MGQNKRATVVAAPFVIPMLNPIDFIAEDDYIADEGDDVAQKAAGENSKGDKDFDKGTCFDKFAIRMKA